MCAVFFEGTKNASFLVPCPVIFQVSFLNDGARVAGDTGPQVSALLGDGAVDGGT